MCNLLWYLETVAPDQSKAPPASAINTREGLTIKEGILPNG